MTKTSKRATLFTSTEDVDLTLKKECCKTTKCLFLISKEFLTNLRGEYCRKNTLQQNEYLSIVLKNQLASGRYVVNGKEFCSEAIKCLFHVSDRRLTRIRTLNEEGIIHFEHGSKGVAKNGENTLELKALIEEWMEDCEVIPNKDGQRQALIGYSRRMLYEWSKEMLLDKSPARSTFYAILKTDFRHLKFPKDNAFAKCSTCIDIKNQKNSTTERAIKKKLEENLKSHNNDQQRERLAYANKKQLARLNGSLYTSIAIDGMDQMKTRLPKFYPISKDFDRNLQVQLHITGVKVHAETEEAYIYVDVKQV